LFASYEDDVIVEAAETTIPSAAAEQSPAATVPTERQGNSETNVQEAGVDEGDTTEHDGRYLYASVGRQLRVIDTTTGIVVATIRDSLPTDQLILRGTRLLVVSRANDQNATTQNGVTEVSTYDVTNPLNPVPDSTRRVSGTVTTVRAIGDTARVVVQRRFADLGFMDPSDPGDEAMAEARRHNADRVTSLRAADFIPELNEPQGLRCEDVTVVKSSLLDGLTTVVTIDLIDGAVSQTALTATATGTYQSRDRLYIWSERWVENEVRTDVQVIDTSTPKAKFVQSVDVPGNLINQFAVSEFNGALRIATSIRNKDISSIITFTMNDGRFRKVAQLDGLGHPGEQIYAVRYSGAKAYVVTFRTTDPLYVVDLSDPTRPRLEGELQIPGYSTYLQVIAPNRAIGIGQGSDSGGSGDGQVSLFDVSDPKNPTRLDTLDIGVGSLAEADHHAFLWWPKTQTLVVPFQPRSIVGANGEAVNPRTPVMVITIDGDKLVRRGRVTHQSNDGTRSTETAFSINRSMVINNQLVTVSATAVKSTDLVDLFPNWYLAP
jgi:hypothetical protein